MKTRKVPEIGIHIFKAINHVCGVSVSGNDGVGVDSDARDLKFVVGGYLLHTHRRCY